MRDYHCEQHIYLQSTIYYLLSTIYYGSWHLQGAGEEPRCLQGAGEGKEAGQAATEATAPPAGEQ